MSDNERKSLGEVLYAGIDSNGYLNELYENILYNYSLKLFGNRSKDPKTVDIPDALRFADLLSKSMHPEKSERHKIWAQEIVSLIRSIYHPDKHPVIDLLFGSVLTNSGNLPGRTKLTPSYKSGNILDRAFCEFAEDFMVVPAEPTKHFMRSQKNIYDRLTDDYLSYSGPTSMGKSFIMQMFIKTSYEKSSKKEQENQVGITIS
jgi:hypothetical protein